MRVEFVVERLAVEVRLPDEVVQDVARRRHEIEAF